jgi:DNA-binding LytR/AlgR family response regulator
MLTDAALSPLVPDALMTPSWLSLTLRLAVAGAQSAIAVPLHSILRLEASRNYVRLVTWVGHFRVRGSLRSWEQRLPSEMVLRVHRSRLLHRAHIRQIVPSGHGDFRILQTDGSWQRSGREYRDAIAALRRRERRPRAHDT